MKKKILWLSWCFERKWPQWAHRERHYFKDCGLVGVGLGFEVSEVEARSSLSRSLPAAYLSWESLVI